MKAKLVRERLDFDRGEDPKKSMSIGRANRDNSLRMLFREMKRIIEEGIEEGYDDFYNVEYDRIDDPTHQEAYKYFVENWEENWRDFEKLMRQEGIDTEEIPQMDETVFILA